jgi:signal transduction histidine kinase
MQAPARSGIMVVDHDPVSLRSIERALAADGYRDLRLFTDGRQALDELSHHDVHLVICDLDMPKIAGLSLLQLIKGKVAENEFLPVLALTLESSSAARRRALLLGADDCLTKPTNEVEVTVRVKHMLQLRSLRASLSNSRSDQASEVFRAGEMESTLAGLQHVIKAKDMFIASVSHELRTPLTAVLGFAEVLSGAGNGLSSEEMAEAARMIAEQAADLSAIIDDLLIAARSEIDTVQVVEEDVDLTREVNSVVQGIAEAERTRIHLPSGSLIVRGDHLRVRQILRNLIMNALRHGGAVVSVELGTPSRETGTVIVVDNGPGIPAELVERLFEPYFHGPGDSGQPEAIGLGLSVSRFLARLMGGDITVGSHPRGTAFELTLPAA